MSDYKTKHSFEARLKESRNIVSKFPGRVPLILEKATRHDKLPDIDKNKYLVPLDITVGQFIWVVRKRIALPPETALFIFINNTLPSTSTLMREVYAQFADEDGFLYAKYGGENTFG